MAQHEATRVQLEQQLMRLLKREGKIEADLRQTLDKDWQDQAIELENDRVLEGLDDMTLNEVRSIRTALRRIADGTYGMCTSCGQPIGKDRLAAMPAALTCLACSTAPRRTS